MSNTEPSSPPRPADPIPATTTPAPEALLQDMQGDEPPARSGSRRAREQQPDRPRTKPQVANHVTLEEMDLRGVMARRLLFLVAFWMTLVLGILIYQLYLTQKPLSDVTLGILVGSTTINVVGLLYTVTKYLFPNK